MMWPLWAIRAAGILKRIPWQVWAGLALLAVWYWERDRHADARETEVRAEMQAIIDRMEQASAQARKDAIAARNSEALALIELKETTDEARAEIERTNLERARAFAARGGVQPQCDRGGARPPVAAPADRGAEGGDGSGAVPELDDLQGGSLVTVTARDVEVCTVNTSRLLAAQPWGVQLEARNREPVEP